MGFSEIVESVFFGENVKQVSNDKIKAGVILKAINFYGVYGGISAGPQALILTLLLFWLI